MLFLLALFACTESEPVDTGEALPQPAPLEEPTGSCPAMVESGGELELVSAETVRTARIWTPSAGVQGAPLLFVWHYMGGSPEDLDRALGLQEQADTLGAVVVAPRALPDNVFEWEFVNESDQDIALYDDLRSCLVTELDLDIRRVYTTGISAGALWSSYLTIHRADTLAASLIISGGTYPVVTYDEPEADIPVLLFHGGPTDSVSGGSFSLDFQQATLAFAEELAEDVSTAVVCEHSLGHTLPPSGVSTFETFLFAHAYGEPSPFASGDLSALPAGCVMADAL